MELKHFAALHHINIAFVQVCATRTRMAARKWCSHWPQSVVWADESPTSCLAANRYYGFVAFDLNLIEIAHCSVPKPWTAAVPQVCKKCDIDLNKRAGELTTDEVNKIVAVVSKPLEFKIPAWMLNRQRDVKDGKTSQKYANFLDQALREETELNQFVWFLSACVVSQIGIICM